MPALVELTGIEPPRPNPLRRAARLGAVVEGVPVPWALT